MTTPDDANPTPVAAGGSEDLVPPHGSREGSGVEWKHMHDVIKALQESVQLAEEMLDEDGSESRFGVAELSVEFSAELNVVDQEKGDELASPSPRHEKMGGGRKSHSGLRSLLRFHSARPGEEDQDLRDTVLARVRVRLGRRITVDRD